MIRDSMFKQTILAFQKHAHCKLEKKTHSNDYIDFEQCGILLAFSFSGTMFEHLIYSVVQLIQNEMNLNYVVSTLSVFGFDYNFTGFLYTISSVGNKNKQQPNLVSRRYNFEFISNILFNKENTDIC